MLIVWPLLLVLAVLGGSGEAQSCRRCFKGKGSNLAKGLPAFQSSDYVHKISGVAGKAVDGNCAGDWFRATCTHTNLDMEPWWYVDLGGDYAISTVVVKNREDCCSERLQGAQIHVGYTIADHGKHNSL
ncbi:fucolectin-like [Hemicordylus capensis]|uniref:fucolectin-like n=1 Tax=Hemicordylus capensis TaxID=884348 RepID=UPI0023038244|nr:fucolectin-like [Hemicordylus capensis]